MKYYGLRIAVWGGDVKETVRFDSKEARDKYYEEHPKLICDKCMVSESAQTVEMWEALNE